MPELSRFFGIIITLYYQDHGPPHFHVRYGAQRALVAIDSLSVLAGELSPAGSRAGRRMGGIAPRGVARDVEPGAAAGAAEADRAAGVRTC